MCGIIGAIADRDIVPVIIDGLRQVEYRGYDSAGIAVLNGHIERIRREGKVKVLEGAISSARLNGTLAIGHTRWATTGKVNEENAHPHISRDEVVLVHNGVIEKHQELRARLIELGYAFESDTDTEAVAHLVHYYFCRHGNLRLAVQTAVAQLEGTYALVVCALSDPQRMIGTKRGAPLMIGLGKGENFLASAGPALVRETRDVIYLEEGDVADVTRTTVEIFDRTGAKVARDVRQLNIEAEDADKGQYDHFMQKEIHQQPKAILDTIADALKNGISPALFGDIERILARIRGVRFLACGTSSYSGRIAQQWFESIAGIPAHCEVASEYLGRDSIPQKRDLIVTISQSGETSDTLEALRHAQSLGHMHTLSICNVPESSIPRASKLVFITRAGLEVSVASTKAFTTQLAALFILALTIAKAKRRLTKAKEAHYLDMLRHLPGSVQHALNLEPQIQSWAKQFIDKEHALFLGSGVHHPVALEGALKLKEITYIHAEAYPAGELKHGPLALVDSNMPVVVIAPNDKLFEKVKTAISEVRTRGGQVYVLTDEGSTFAASEGIQVIRVPRRDGILSPVVHAIPVQLLAYHTAVLLEREVDQPRNLAKSVTVG
jgi:glucosamine--fructose-6-phosphate aminotransferase (isomerizing)